jgi:hypothetical protein
VRVLLICPHRRCGLPKIARMPTLTLPNRVLHRGHRSASRRLEPSPAGMSPRV